MLRMLLSNNDSILLVEKGLPITINDSQWTSLTSILDTSGVSNHGVLDYKGLPAAPTPSVMLMSRI